MALKSAVELRIADIIHSHGSPIILSQIAAGISFPRYHLPRAYHEVAGPQKDLHRYSSIRRRRGSLRPNPHVQMALHGAEHSLAPMLMMENDHRALAPWHYLSNCVREGGIAFQKAHGREIWDYCSMNPEFNKIFNDAIGCTARITMKAIMAGYKDGFCGFGSMVDVGGGTGAAMGEIVKWIHDWNDEDFGDILKNCRKAIPEKTRKMIIIDVILNPEGDGMFDNTGLVFDLLMIAHSSGGKARTELEWKKVLGEGDFPHYNIIKIAAFPSIIETFPE